MTYTVEVTREGDIWIADVVDVPGAHTSAGNLVVLRERVQEVIGLVLDRPEDERFEVTLVFDGVDQALTDATQLGDRRLELELEQRDLVEQSNAAVAELAGAGWSVRDIGGALRLSPGRVSQILAAR